MFEQQMGKSVEVYIDDMVVKSKLVADHIRQSLSNSEKVQATTECIQMFIWGGIRKILRLYGDPQRNRS